MDSSIKKFLIVFSVLLFALFGFFFSNIKGYYRFKQYCEAEGGLRVYEPLERNVGWLAEDYYAAHTAALLDGVGFVRYTDKIDGKSYDIRYLGGDPQFDNSFVIIPENPTRHVLYRWLRINQYVPLETRLGKSGYEVLAIGSNKVLARFYMFRYQKFSRLLFDAPSDTSCFDDPSRGAEPSKLRKEFNSAIKN